MIMHKIHYSLNILFTTLLLGLIISLYYIFPENEIIQKFFYTTKSLHILSALSWVIMGNVVNVFYVYNIRLHRLVFPLLFLSFIYTFFYPFLITDFHLEYFLWPTYVAIVLIVIFCYLIFRFFQYLQSAHHKGRIFDASDLIIFMGLLLFPLSMLELVILQQVKALENFSFFLSIEWHGVDIIFGSLNLLSYGVAIKILKKSNVRINEPLRISTVETALCFRKIYTLKHLSSIFLKKYQSPLIIQKDGNGSSIFFIVILFISILFTFAHHFYPIPQPNYIRTVAFVASMFAGLSFINNYKIVKSLKASTLSVANYLFYCGYQWSLFSILTGILMSIPQLNTFSHGTFIVLSHAMGSMIGINTFLILAVFFQSLEKKQALPTNKLLQLGKGMHYSFILFILMFMMAGITQAMPPLINIKEPTFFHMLTKMILMLTPFLGLIFAAYLFLFTKIFWRKEGESFCAV